MRSCLTVFGKVILVLLAWVLLFALRECTQAADQPATARPNPAQVAQARATLPLLEVQRRGPKTGVAAPPEFPSGPKTAREGFDMLITIGPGESFVSDELIEHNLAAPLPVLLAAMGDG